METQEARWNKKGLSSAAKKGPSLFPKGLPLRSVATGVCQKPPPSKKKMGSAKGGHPVPQRKEKFFTPQNFRQGVSRKGSEKEPALGDSTSGRAKNGGKKGVPRSQGKGESGYQGGRVFISNRGGTPLEKTRGLVNRGRITKKRGGEGKKIFQKKRHTTSSVQKARVLEEEGNPKPSSKSEKKEKRLCLWGDGPKQTLCLRSKEKGGDSSSPRKKGTQERNAPPSQNEKKGGTKGEQTSRRSQRESPNSPERWSQLRGDFSSKGGNRNKNLPWERTS